MESIFGSERSQMTILIEQMESIIEAKFRKYLGLAEDNVVIVEPILLPEFVTLTGLCKEIGCSKPTMMKWMKNKRIDYLINRSMKKVGKRKLYDVAEIKKSMEENITFFGNKWRKG